MREKNSLDAQDYPADTLQTKPTFTETCTSVMMENSAENFPDKKWIAEKVLKKWLSWN